MVASMKIANWLAAVSLLCMTACSGSSASTPAPANAGYEPAAQTSPEEERKQADLERLRRYQEAACDQVGTVLTECAVDDARKQLSSEELAKLDIEKTATLHKAEFVDRCTESAMSLRQVKVFDGCLAGKTSCEAFLECLDQAKPEQ
jgi:hypothetical protein